MSLKAAILGLGERGNCWASTFAAAGWEVVGFDPDASVSFAASVIAPSNRKDTISAAVSSADWIAVCLPDRLELVQAVLQRAQSEAPRRAVVGVVTNTFSVDEVQNCSMRPATIVRATIADDGGFAVEVSPKTSDETRAAAEALMAQLSASRASQAPDAESA